MRLRSTPGGIRTHDLRFRKLSAKNHKPLSGKDKSKQADDVYTPVYTDDSELQFVIESWERLPKEKKSEIVIIIKNKM